MKRGRRNAWAIAASLLLLSLASSLGWTPSGTALSSVICALTAPAKDAPCGDSQRAGYGDDVCDEGDDLDDEGDLAPLTVQSDSHRPDRTDGVPVPFNDDDSRGRLVSQRLFRPPQA